jgi:Protein of unknown function (DUF1064)
VAKILRIRTAKLQKSKFNQQWHEIDGRKIFFRSSWEVDYARYLQLLKEQKIIEEWEHEPRVFWFDKIKRGVRSYLPDFRVTQKDGTHYWVEVKGYMDAKSNTKIKRFAKYYPEERLIIIDREWFEKNRAKFPWKSA